MKKRLIAVIGIIVIVLIVAFAVIGGSTSAKVTSVADAAKGNLSGQKIQVTGVVVDNSYTLDSKGVLSFDITDENNKNVDKLHVSYDKGVSATFGNGVSAICTGRLDNDGTLIASELVTKCPSKYENATDALSVDQLFGYGSSMIGKTVKVTGYASKGTFNDPTQQVRFTLVDSQNSTKGLNVHFEGALPQGYDETNAVFVVTGALNEQGTFQATEVSLKG